MEEKLRNKLDSFLEYDGVGTYYGYDFDLNAVLASLKSLYTKGAHTPYAFSDHEIDDSFDAALTLRLEDDEDALL